MHWIVQHLYLYKEANHAIFSIRRQCSARTRMDMSSASSAAAISISVYTVLPAASETYNSAYILTRRHHFTINDYLHNDYLYSVNHRYEFLRPSIYTASQRLHLTSTLRQFLKSAASAFFFLLLSQTIHTFIDFCFQLYTHRWTTTRLTPSLRGMENHLIGLS